MQVKGAITHYYIFYRQLSPPLCDERDGVFTNKQYRLDCSISTKMASQPCGGTIANTVRVFTATCGYACLKIMTSVVKCVNHSMNPVHVISLPGVSLPCINDVSHPILCDISPLVQHKAVSEMSVIPMNLPKPRYGVMGEELNFQHGIHSSMITNLDLFILRSICFIFHVWKFLKHTSQRKEAYYSKISSNTMLAYSNAVLLVHNYNSL